MPKQIKLDKVSYIKGELENVDGFVLADFKGLNIKELDGLRKDVKKEGGLSKIEKNTLIQKAFEEQKIEGLDDYLKKNTIMFYSKEDALKILKSLVDYSKANKKFIIKGGYYDGKAFDEEGVKALSSLPGKKELLSMVVGSVNGVISSFVGTLNSVMTTFVGTVEALEKKKESEGK